MQPPSTTPSATGGRRLQTVFAETVAADRAALVGYLPAGFPTPTTAPDHIRAMVAGGVDIVEVGVPYSDPLMDGPVIQAAAQQALEAGTRMEDVFACVRAAAEAGAAALVMSYWNPIERYGIDRFLQQLTAAGGTGVITPDLIPDEAARWIEAARAREVDTIFLVAPASSDARLAVATGACRGFVYAASTMGVTGVRASVGGAAAGLVARTRQVTDLPVAVGLGVSTAAQAHEVARFADGVIVGSAFVRAVPEGTAAVTALAADLRQGVQR